MLARLAIFAMGAPFMTGTPVMDGERLNYRVSWAIVRGAGEIQIEAKRDALPRPSLVVTTTTATRKLARMLLPFDAEGRSVFDLNTGRLLSLRESSSQRGRQSAHEVTFDYSSRQATYTGSKSAGQPKAISMPQGDPTDLIMGLLQTRTWDLPLGEKRDALVLFNDDFYELTIHHTRDEEVQTPMGLFKTSVLEPRMEKTPPKGMFKRGSTVRVWISQDTRRLPVRFEVEFKIGTGTATLESYTPPHATDPRS